MTDSQTHFGAARKWQRLPECQRSGRDAVRGAVVLAPRRAAGGAREVGLGRADGGTGGFAGGFPSGLAGSDRRAGLVQDGGLLAHQRDLADAVAAQFEIAALQVAHGKGLFAIAPDPAQDVDDLFAQFRSQLRQDVARTTCARPAARLAYSQLRAPKKTISVQMATTPHQK